jgi:hypothetical protein
MYLATVILDYLVPREAYSDVLRGLLTAVLIKINGFFSSKTLYFHFEKVVFFSDDNFFVPLAILLHIFSIGNIFHGI